MIIKFNARGVWHIFDEVDSLQYRYIGSDRDIITNDYTLDYTDADSEDVGGSKSIRVELMFMNKNQLEGSQIIANSPIYLLNNEGRTIEKI